MKKLKHKVFIVIFSILTLVTTGILVGYNAQLYNQEYHNVERSLNQSVMGFGNFGLTPPDGRGNENERENNNLGNIRFIDSTVYTVLLSENNSVYMVINHSGNDVSDEDIEAIADTLITGENCTVIGNLYTRQYAYRCESRNFITIVDTGNIRQVLRSTLLISLVLFALLELIIFLLAQRLTRWIAKPVADSFDKQKQFIADASHELKTPLAVIMASADALETAPTEKKWLDNIKSESDRMNKLIADLLELAKSEEVSDQTEFAIDSLSKAVEKSVLTFEGIMFEKGIFLKDEIEEDIFLNMNVYKIKQLLSILLDNAIQHSPAGGTITVKLWKEKDILLTVTNEGEGIPKGQEDKIFERFYRVDESRNRNENRYGLGLAIAKNICLSHHADITAASANGSTTFKVVFKQ